MEKRGAPPSKSFKTDRVPPYSEEAERGVLGSAMLGGDRVIDLAIERKITPEAFYLPSHRLLFEQIVEMHQQNRPVDMLTLGERLRSQNLDKAIGDENFIETLVDSTPTVAHAEYYIDIVRQKHIYRMIIERACQSIENCFTEEQAADELLGVTEQAFFEISEMQHSLNSPWPELIKNSMSEIELIYQQKKVISGIPTGYKNLDKTLLGFQPSDMIILAARPSMGKTSLALNLAEHIALGNNSDHTARPVAVFSLEMSSEQLVRRMICCHAKVSAHKLASGYVSNVNHSLLMEAASKLMKAKIVIDDTAGLSVLELRSRARRLHRKHGIQFIVIDYLQLLNYPQYGKEGRQRETAAISGALKAMAKELKVPILVLSQLSRAPETRDRLAKPKLSDLRDSGSIEQDADVVCLLRRPAYYPDDPDHDDKRLSIVDVAKHRNGPTGEVQLNFEQDFMRFEDRAYGVSEEHEYQVSGTEVDS